MDNDQESRFDDSGNTNPYHREAMEHLIQDAYTDSDC